MVFFIFIFKALICAHIVCIGHIFTSRPAALPVHFPGVCVFECEFTLVPSTYLYKS